jgi:hypothetical protein
LEAIYGGPNEYSTKQSRGPVTTITDERKDRKDNYFDDDDVLTRCPQQDSESGAVDSEAAAPLRRDSEPQERWGHLAEGVTAAATGAIAGAVVVLAQRSVYDPPTMLSRALSMENP